MVPEGGWRDCVPGEAGPGARLSRLHGLLGLGLVALLGFLLSGLAYSANEVSALPEWIHDGASTCEVCHHPDPPSFQPCASCHPDPQVPNGKCTQCHAGKTTKGESCWQCHAPGAPQPEPTVENCVGCHGPLPHLGAQLGTTPACTACHSTDPTPHHDALDQVAPDECTDCHTDVTEGHNGNACVACHRTDIHPHYPELPATCNACHDPAVYNGRPNCLECHFGQPYSGQADQDVHDTSIPDAPISARSCRSCHPEAQKHAGQVACLTCHDQATAFHHGTAASPGFPACETCHQMFQHGGPLPCTVCHQGAQHQVDPPTPGAGVCQRCHDPHAFGTRNCYRCHTPPIYHVPPTVPGCPGCHRGYRLHDGLKSCESCHTNVARGHHVGRVGIPSCQKAGCHAQTRHVGKVSCQRCHRRAAHDPTPLNLPANPWLVCDRCHRFADSVRQPCSVCHDETQHSATYRVPGCSGCHEQERHQRKVDCRRCHTNISGGHHDAGAVGWRTCSNCHVGAQVHARDVPAGAGTAGARVNSCEDCHEGQVHGLYESPNRERCLECHERADLHAAGLECIDCHWPATHDATPDANEQGAYSPLELRLPPLSGEGVIREKLVDTGYELAATTALALGLIAAGVTLRLWPARPVGASLRRARWRTRSHR